MTYVQLKKLIDNTGVDTSNLAAKKIYCPER